jgi:hypothetical protein
MVAAGSKKHFFKKSKFYWSNSMMRMMAGRKSLLQAGNRPLIYHRPKNSRKAENLSHLIQVSAYKIQQKKPTSITYHWFRKLCVQGYPQLRFIVVPPHDTIHKNGHDAEEKNLKIRAFADWLTRGGCKADKVSIAYLGDLGNDDTNFGKIRGLGLSASEIIAQDELVITLPTSLHLNMIGSRLDPSKTSTILNISSSIPEALWGLKLGLVLHAAGHDPGVSSLTCAGSCRD